MGVGTTLQSPYSAMSAPIPTPKMLAWCTLRQRCLRNVCAHAGKREAGEGYGMRGCSELLGDRGNLEFRGFTLSVLQPRGPPDPPSGIPILEGQA